MPNTTWSTTDNVQITLSNGNLTATSTGSSGAVRAVNTQRTGKFYVEYRMTTWGNAFSQPGFSTTLTYTPGGGGYNAVVIQNGHIYVNGSDTGSSLSARANGDIICGALDLANKTVWFRVAPSGNWNGSGTANPATNTGGLSVSMLTANGMSPLVQLVQSGDVCTANFGDSAFSGAVPAGFTSGFPAPTLSYTTWNPADLTSLILGGNNQTITSASGAPPAGGVRSVAAKIAGKYYWEYVLLLYPAGGVLGVANASANLSTVNSAAANACAVFPVNGNIYLNGAITGLTLGARSNNDVLSTALDVDNKLIWFRVAPSGNWNGSGTANPATGAGGVSVSVLSTPLYALFSVPSNQNTVITTDFGDSPFVGAVPSGFIAGLPPGSGILAGQDRVMVMA